MTVGYRTYDYLAFYKIGCSTRVNKCYQPVHFIDKHLPITHNVLAPFVTFFFKSHERRRIWFSGVPFCLLTYHSTTNPLRSVTKM
jgi:hypothetical protein